jgi:excisionase family DNA binding protein
MPGTANIADPAPELMTVAEVAALLGRSDSSIRRAIDAGKIGRRFGGRRVISPADVPLIEAELERRANWREHKARAVAT